MKLPSIRRILKNDFEEEQHSLVEKLGNAVNYNFDKIWNVLNGEVSLADNTKTQIKDITLTVDSSGIPTETVSFQSKFSPARPIGAMIIDVQNKTNPDTYPTSWPGVSYRESSGTVFINHISGLTSGNKYFLKIVFFG